MQNFKALAYLIFFCWMTHLVECSDLLSGLKNSDEDQLIAHLGTMAKTGDDKYIPVLEAFKSGSLFVYKDNIYYNLGTTEDDELNEFAQAADPYTKESVAILSEPLHPEHKNWLPLGDVEFLEPNRNVRQEVMRTKMVINLYSENEIRRAAAVKKCAFDDGALELIKDLNDLGSNDPVESIRFFAQESAAIIAYREGSEELKYNAVEKLGQLQSLRSLELIKDGLKSTSLSPKERKLLKTALSSIEMHAFWVQMFDLVKSGLSSGSILILMALGLSITFGMMGIINMAHGELMMIGAYTTYCVQLLFGHTSSNPNNIYFFLALPASCLMSMGVGALIEFTVVRKLYNHPLESLLATYGIGLILIQITRIMFGDNCPSNSPTWLQGGVEIFRDMTLQYNRLFVFMLTIVCLVGVVYIFKSTTLGLKMKASMQNRNMASAMGINTRQVDLFTFMLGSGLAGIAGNALITIGGITPDMGQNYIVDSFLVVVTGGVGNVFGVVCSGMGLGVINKTLESLLFGAVWSKIIVLLMVIIFIQFRPSGLFALKGRHADD
jgi:urea transport system permease protein